LKHRSTSRLLSIATIDALSTFQRDDSLIAHIAALIDTLTSALFANDDVDNNNDDVDDENDNDNDEKRRLLVDLKFFATQQLIEIVEQSDQQLFSVSVNIVVVLLCDRFYPINTTTKQIVGADASGDIEASRTQLRLIANARQTPTLRATSAALRCAARLSTQLSAQRRHFRDFRPLAVVDATLAQVILTCVVFVNSNVC
jgi:hypothetical protein